MNVADISNQSQYSSPYIHKVDPISLMNKRTEKINKEYNEKQQEASVIYDRTNIKEYLQNDAKLRAEQFENMVFTSIGNQKLMQNNVDVFSSKFWKQFSEDGLSIDEAAVKQAQQDISKDGYWGAEKTSQRILDFAKALSGDDVEKFKDLSKAFEKGYNLATKRWGDELPELCKETYDLVQKGFKDPTSVGFPAETTN